MDPNLYSEQPGMSPDMRNSEDGANYLRRMKAEANAAGAVSGTPVSASISGATYGGKERRRSPRFRCTGSVEFKAEGSDVRMWGTLTDVSLHGCYVEMSTTFPVGTKVEITLESLGIRVRAHGTIRVSYPFLGMGICLSNLEPAQQTQLEQLLSAIVGQNAGTDPALATGSAAQNLSTAIEPGAFLEEMRRFFVNHQLLSREEFLRIAQRCRPS